MFYLHSPCFIPLRHGYYGFDLKFTGHSHVFFLYHKTQNKNKTHKKKKKKIRKLEKKVKEKKSDLA